MSANEIQTLEIPLTNPDTIPTDGDDTPSSLKEMEADIKLAAKAKNWGADAAETPHERSLLDATKTGIVNPRSALGLKFPTACKRASSLAGSYSRPVGHEAKRAFRAEWAAVEWNIRNRKR